MRARPAFLWQMARNALKVRPPLGLIRDFITDEVGEASGTIDLKAGGIRGCLWMGRVSWPLHAALQSPILPIGYAPIDAFYFLQMLRLQHQQANTASPTPNRIAPDTLNDLERASNKEALRQARQLQTRLALDYSA